MNNNTDCNVNNYTCNEGLFLPLVNEYTWPIWGRAVIYCLGLCWCFLAVAIIADTFMCSIEKIISKTRIVKVANPDMKSGYEEIEVKVWNDTVANLTLMALGSSAPEIFLSTIEIIVNKFEAGKLGPSTIVGSAAFNLLVITAICIFAIPEGEVRHIKYIKVFATTSTFSLFAYIWLVVILMWSSPGYVSLWEAIVTLLFFPILVITAYIADKDYCSKKPSVEDSTVEIGFSDDERPIVTEGGHIDKQGMASFLRELGKHPELSEEDAARLAATKVEEKKSHGRLWYRINATRGISGANKLVPTMNPKLAELYDHMKTREHVRKEMGSHETLAMVDMSGVGNKAIVEFTATACAIMENEKRVRIGVRRYGRNDVQVLVKVETVEGTAEADKDYIPIKTTLVFEPMENYKYIEVEIIDDNEWEPDEQFYVKLSMDPSQKEAILGKKTINTVTIINDDEPGIIEFAKASFLFKESAGKAMIPVTRVNGADGRISVSWKTEDMTAISSKDYVGGEGTITFEHGETTKMIEIPLIDDQTTEKDECFKVDLVEPTGGAQLGRVKKTIITIVNDDEFNSMVSRLVDLTNMNIDALRVDHVTYRDQFRNAMNVNGGDVENASSLDYFMHFLTFGFKVIFAIVPPVSMWGGWLSFIVSVMMIGVLTALINDLASVFGCLINLDKEIVAITFVALGTSLPDLFASKTAAVNESTADFSIGNITGSNSVNVFLGLGLPWTIAAIVHAAQNGSFKVDPGALVFSVIVYTSFALLCIGLLLMRRYIPIFGGELGGHKGLKIFSAVFLVFLWLTYIVVSSLQVKKIIIVNF